MNPSLTETSRSLFRKHIALPQQHGSWALWLGPFLTGAVIGGRLTAGLVWLTVAMLGMFLALQPLTILVKVQAGRRPAEERRPALLWLGLYGLVTALGTAGLLAAGQVWVLALGGAMLPLLAWQLALVARRAERGQLLVEALGAVALALSAPAAQAVSAGVISSVTLSLWVLCAAQAAGGIIHVYACLDYRRLKTAPAWPERWATARASLLWNSAALLAALGAASLGWTPALAPLGLGVMWAEAVWGGLGRPPVGAKPVIIGARQTVITVLVGLALIWAYRAG